MIATNAFKQAVVGTYTASATVIELNSITNVVGNADYLPNGGFNLILYDGLFGNPADANNGGDYEILECSSVNYATNEITVVRARENTTAVIIDASSWQVIYGATVAFFAQFEDADATILKEADVVDTLVSTSAIAPLSANQGKELEDTKVSKTSNTGSAIIPSGTEAQRDVTPAKGYFRYNEDEDLPEFYDPTAEKWELLQKRPPFSATGGTITDATIGGEDYRIHTFLSGGDFETNIEGEVEYLIVAGGGGGAGNVGGGGGAGGLRNNIGTPLEVTGGIHPVAVGGGGNAGTKGSDSSFFTIISEGGGFGNTGGFNGGDGGSGGGDGRAASVGGLGTAGQGNDGGTSNATAGAGGGGAGAVGVGGTSGVGGDGGDGLELNMNGTLTYYAGGGGGNSTENGSGGQGGGGDAQSGTGSSGTANTGGGGGGAVTEGGSGGSGIVIIRYKI